MNNDPLLYEKIDLYLKNRLSEEEHSIFTQEIVKDNALRELVDTHRIAHQLILTKQLINLQKKMQTDLSQSGKSQLFRFLLGTGFIIAVGCILYFPNKSEITPAKPEKLLTTTNTSIESVPTIPFAIQKEKPKKNAPLTSPEIPDNGFSRDMVITMPSGIEENNTKKISNTPMTISDTGSESFKKNTPIDCSQMTIAQAISVSPTCVGEQNGKIVIAPSGINGGKTPFRYSLNKKEILSSENEFHYLNAGTYTIYVSDGNNCLVQKMIEVEEKQCLNSKAFAFTPEFEQWKVPVSQNKHGNITIYNKSGILVYESEIFSDKENLWDGNSNTGQAMGTGYYTFKINYSDGEQVVGSVSIMHP